VQQLEISFLISCLTDPWFLLPLPCMIITTPRFCLGFDVT
jgi:hypothetical protein